MPSDADCLNHMRKIVAGAWSPSFPAEDRNGKAVLGRDQRAALWSLTGALMMACPVAFADTEQRMRLHTLKAFGGDMTAFERDEFVTGAQILAAIDVAIQEVS